MPYKDPEKKRAHDAARHKAKRQMKRDALLPTPPSEEYDIGDYHRKVALKHYSYENYLWACGVLGLVHMNETQWLDLKDANLYMNRPEPE
jgi:hypothetical protein